MHDVTVAEWVVLRELCDRTSIAPGDLATHLGMTKGAISKLVDRLVVKQLILRKVTPSDLRGQALSLTPKGRASVPQLCVLAAQNEAEFFGHMSEEERSALTQMMKDIIRHTSAKRA